MEIKLYVLSIILIFINRKESRIIFKKKKKFSIRKGYNKFFFNNYCD